MTARGTWGSESLGVKASKRGDIGAALIKDSDSPRVGTSDREARFL